MHEDLLFFKLLVLLNVLFDVLVFDLLLLLLHVLLEFLFQFLIFSLLLLFRVLAGLLLDFVYEFDIGRQLLLGFGGQGGTGAPLVQELLLRDFPLDHLQLKLLARGKCA